LPSWLQDYEGAFKEVQRDAHTVSQILLGILEKELELAAGTLTNIHVLDEPTHSFLRILRYPGARPGEKPFDRPRFFAHRDIVSVAMLFTWVCGLQIPKEDPDMVDAETETEESWRWVAPEAGYAIVNLGDTMPIFTNGALASGRHRVVASYGEQAKLDRVCVLLSSRPTWETPMKPFISPVIPAQTEEQAAEPVKSCKVWGDDCVKVFIEENVKGGKR
jgi:isopenicillin N synthase-like dioxygenase